MSRILIGSSNVYRFYSAEKYSSYKPYNLVRCVNIETYRARMGCIDPKEKLIIVSVLEKFLGGCSQKCGGGHGKHRRR